MKLTTEIVLVGDKGPTQPYVIRLSPYGVNGVINNYILSSEGDMYRIYPQNLQECVVRHKNDWYIKENTGQLATGLKTASVRLYFPQYSVDTYDHNVTYNLELYTYIHGHKVELGCFNFKRIDSLACPEISFGSSEQYHEVLEFNILDPFSLHYSDECLSIRRLIGEPDNINATGSMLYVAINVIEKSEDDHYIMGNGWTGGQNGIMFDEQGDLKLHIGYDPEDDVIDFDLRFNNTFDSINQYISETYNTAYTTAVFQYVIMDKDNIYYERSIVSDENGSFDNSFNEDYEISGLATLHSHEYIDAPVFTSWDEWKDGMWIEGTLSFVGPEWTDEDISNGDYLPFLTIFSNKLILNQDLFALLLHDDHDNMFPNQVNLENVVNMQNINLTAINRIEKTIKVIAPTDSTKNHIIQPVFYQTKDNIKEITIHPTVTENISINLDKYKSSVKTFMVQIEGVSFKEIGRTPNGVVFTIMGSMLPKKINNGSLYILNQDGVLVTTGKYSYVY